MRQGDYANLAGDLTSLISELEAIKGRFGPIDVGFNSELNCRRSDYYVYSMLN